MGTDFSKAAERVEESAGQRSGQVAEGAAGRLDLPAQSIAPPTPHHLPKEIADYVSDRQYSSWDAMRRDMNRAIAHSESARIQLGIPDSQVPRMLAGLNPTADPSGWAGKRTQFEYDHIRERRDGHDVLDPYNLRLITPTHHIHKVIRHFYKVADPPIS